MMMMMIRYCYFKKKFCVIVYNYFVIFLVILFVVYNVGKVCCNLIDSNVVEEKVVNDC